MKTLALIAVTLVSAMTLCCRPVSAQNADPSATNALPMTPEEKQAAYNQSIEIRTANILKALAIADSEKSNRVHDIIVTHYHALRARDEAIDDELSDLQRGSDEWRAQRTTILMAMSLPFHDRFLAALAKELTPEQIETIKDQMTYGKVKFTYSAYCLIVPTMTDEQKAKVLDLLKQAREQAMEGGSAGEKSDIFQQYKNQINSYLKSNGIDMEKATEEWNAKQKALQKTSTPVASNAAPAAN